MTRHLVLASIAATLMGCAATQTPCSSRQCLSLRAQQPIISECVRDLEFYALNRTARKAIDRKYQYPLTNGATYTTLSRMGAIGPSPRDWCEAYAAQRARVVMPPAALSGHLLK